MQSLKIETLYKVIIIGAGPAGLSLSYNLTQLGVSHLVLESKGIGESWRRMPDFLSLVSPHRTNLLGKDRCWNYAKSGSTASDYATYLESFAKRNRLPVQENSAVTGLNFNGSVWNVNTVQREYQAESIVLSLGYFGRPIIPNGIVYRNVSIPMIHYSNLSGKFVSQGLKRVLVVGKRLSSGQIIEMFHNFSPETELFISTRSPIRFSTEGLISKFFFFFMNEIEWLINFILKLFGKSLAKIDVKMTTPIARQLIQSGKVKVLPELSAVEENKVVFKGGQEEAFDAIVWATGFSELWKLKMQDWGLSNKVDPSLKEFSVIGHKNLFVLGTESLVNFRSRFIRGMIDDAKKLSHMLKKI